VTCLWDTVYTCDMRVVSPRYRTSLIYWMTRFNMWHTVYIRDIRVMSPFSIYRMTRSYMWHIVYICGIPFVYIMTRLNMWHFVYVCGIPFIHVTYESRLPYIEYHFYIEWLVQICDMFVGYPFPLCLRHTNLVSTYKSLALYMGDRIRMSQI